MNPDTVLCGVLRAVYLSTFRERSHIVAQLPFLVIFGPYI